MTRSIKQIKDERYAKARKVCRYKDVLGDLTCKTLDTKGHTYPGEPCYCGYDGALCVCSPNYKPENDDNQSEGVSK